MWRFFAIVGAACTAGAAVFGVPWPYLTAPAAICMVAIAWRFRCAHRGPLALLPPVTDTNGDRLPARWFCDRCGRTWTAEFEHDRKPVPKFVGFDEKKAARAAERAFLLEEQRRSIALQRAGLSRTRLQKKPRRTPAEVGETTTPGHVVPIGDVRRQA